MSEWNTNTELLDDYEVSLNAVKESLRSSMLTPPQKKALLEQEENLIRAIHSLRQYAKMEQQKEVSLNVNTDDKECKTVGHSPKK